MEKLKRVKELIELLFEHNEYGKGFRSIGKWSILDNVDDVNDVELNEYQLTHIKKLLEKHGVFILMKEAYSDKYRIHDVYSFTCFFKCNLYGALIYDKLTMDENQLNNICCLIMKEAPLEKFDDHCIGYEYTHQYN